MNIKYSVSLNNQLIFPGIPLMRHVIYLKSTLFIVVFIMMGSKSLNAQDITEAAIYNGFDQAVGLQNTGLYQGTEHVVKYRTINEKSQYFISPRFLSGSVTYAGQEYYGLEIKYDIYEDKVLLKLSSSVSGAALELIRDWVDGFTISGHRFVQIRQQDTRELDTYGFYELTMMGNQMTLLTKHTTERIDKRDKKFVYYEFKKDKSIYLLYFAGDYHMIDSKKELVTLFPQFKTQINDFFKDNSTLKRDNPDDFYISLTRYLDGLVR